MRGEWEQALEQVRQGRVAETAEVVEGIKALPRDQDGVFDLRGMEGNQQDMQEARRALSGSSFSLTRS